VVYPISYSSAGFEDRNIEAALDAIASVGFRYTELCGRAPHIDVPPTGKALIGFRDRLFARGLQASTVHGPTGHHVLGAPDERPRQETVAFLASYIRFATAVDSPDIVIHPVPDPTSLSDVDDPALPARIRDAVLRSLDDLVPIAEESGVRMLIENLPYRCPFPFLSMRELRPLVDGYPEAQVGLVVDTGHASVAGNDPVEEIHLASHRLWGIHLQDAEHDAPRDRHWVPTHGDLDWQAIVGALFQVSYAGAWTFEAHRGRYGETSEEAALQCLQMARQWGLCCPLS
jgi:sugar phosphate isomerase/epimerase